MDEVSHIAQLEANISQRMETLRGITNYTDFMSLLTLICSLETEHPTSAILPNVKRAWFYHGLDRFEAEFTNRAIDASRESAEISTKDPQDLTMTWTLLKSRLNEQFLGEIEYVEAYQRVYLIIHHLVDSTHGEFQTLWNDRLGELEKDNQHPEHPPEQEVHF